MDVAVQSSVSEILSRIYNGNRISQRGRRSIVPLR